LLFELENSLGDFPVELVSHVLHGVVAVVDIFLGFGEGAAYISNLLVVQGFMVLECCTALCQGIYVLPGLFAK
jgi:hypothetical protein